jgi:hypothetical protein
MASSSTQDLSVFFTFLGGYADVNLPKTSYGAVEADWTRAGYIRNYLTLDTPSSITGLSPIGTGADALTGGNLRITSSSTYPNPRFYRWNNLPTSLINTDYTNQGMFIRSVCIANSGGDLTFTQRGFELEMDNGTNRYRVGIYISTSQITPRFHMTIPKAWKCFVDWVMVTKYQHGIAPWEMKDYEITQK